MNPYPRTINRAIAVLAAACFISPILAQAANREADFEWTAGGGNLSWITPGNWSPSGPPGATNEAGFFEKGTTTNPADPTVIVSSDTLVDHIWVGQTNSVSGTNEGFSHNFVIQSGVTLTVRGTNDNGYGPLGSGPEGSVLEPLRIESTYHVGTKANVNALTTVTNTVSGEGTLALDNPNNELNVRQIISNENNSGADHWAVMDMSGLNTFVASLGRIRVGDGESEPMRRASGILLLAKTNTITLTGINSEENVQLVIGNNDVNNNGSRVSELFLGQQNNLNIDEILVGGRKTIGRIQFDPDLTAPTLQLRGSDGTGRLGKLRIGDHSNQPNTGNNTQGFVDLSAGTVDLLVDTIYVGRSSKEGTGPATGTLTLGAGNVDVNTVEVAYQTTDLNTSSTATGTVDVNGTTVVVNDLLRLGRSAGSSAARTATLNINGGSVTVNGEYKNEGTATISITDGSLNLPSGSEIAASSVTLNNGTILNVTSLTVTNGLTAGAGSTITGDPAFDLGNDNIANTWDFAAIPEGLVVNQSLSGYGSLSGSVTMMPGATLIPGGAGLANTLTFFSDLTNNNANIAIDLGTNAFGFPANDQLMVFGNLILSGTNDVLLNNLGSTLDINNNYTLATSSTLIGSAGNLRAAGKLGKSRYTFTFDTTSVPGSVLLDVDLSGSASLNLTWVGDGTANDWDFTSANWDSSGPTPFFNLDTVTFNDSGSASPAVNITEDVAPGTVTVVNSTKDYGFGGPGGIDTANLTKQGTASLTLTNDGNNSFSGSVWIESGAVTFANDGLNTFGGLVTVTNGGSLTWSGNSANTLIGPSFGLPALVVESGSTMAVANSNPNSFGGSTLTIEGTLTFNQTIDATLEASLQSFLATGALIKQGPNTLSISGANGLFTPLLISEGTVRTLSADAISFGGASVANGAALDIRGQSIGATIILSGAGPDGTGALISTGPGHEGTENVGGVIMTGDTTFGGLGPWDTDPVKNSGRLDLGIVSTTNSQAFDLTKVGSNQLTFKDSTVDPALADIDVQEGALLFQGTTDSMGNPANTLSVSAGATLAFYDTATAWDKKFDLTGDGVVSALFNWSGTNTLVGPITLTGDIVLDDGRERASAADNQQLLVLEGAIGGTGGFTKVSVGTTVLSGDNNYSGPTVINGGLFLVNGNNSGSGSVTVNGGTLGGTGSIGGAVTVAAGGSLAPGESIGTLTVNNSVTLGGTTVMEIDRSGSPNSDRVVATSIALGGALVVTNVGADLQDGDTFNLFDGALSGGFVSVVLPDSQTWDTSKLTVDGTITVGAAATPPSFSGVGTMGSDVVINATGTPNGSLTILSTTNAAEPVSNWTVEASSQFDGSGNFSLTNGVTEPQKFFIIRQP